MGPEAAIQTEILLAYGNLPWLRIARMNTGKANMAKPGQKPRWVQFGIPGQPDVMGLAELSSIGWLGRAIGIEVKSPTGRQSPEQQRFQAIFERFGGLYILARSVEDVTAAFVFTKIPHTLLP